MFVRVVVAVLLVTSVAFVSLTSSVSPSGAHPAVLLLVFLLLYILFLLVILLLSIGVVRVRQRSMHGSGDRSMSERALLRRAYMYASVVALAPVIGIAINTVGGVSWREIALIIAFEGIALFYVWKRQ